MRDEKYDQIDKIDKELQESQDKIDTFSEIQKSLAIVNTVL